MLPSLKLLFIIFLRCNVALDIYLDRCDLFSPQWRRGGVEFLIHSHPPPQINVPKDGQFKSGLALKITIKKTSLPGGSAGNGSLFFKKKLFRLENA